MSGTDGIPPFHGSDVLLQETNRACLESTLGGGTLLPRLFALAPGLDESLGPLTEAFLFSLYHFSSPWQIVSRFLAVLPLVYIVYWKKDIRVGIIAHWVLNTVGIIGLLAPLFR